MCGTKIRFGSPSIFESKIEIPLSRKFLIKILKNETVYKKTVFLFYDKKEPNFFFLPD
jgi:hypothetical protein